MNSTKRCIDNFINGNLKTAREEARHESHKDLRETLEEHYFYSPEKAQAAADYLQTGEGFQQACDIR